MGEFDGVPGVAALGGQGRERNGMGAEGNDVIGADHALVAETEAAGEIKARGQGAEVALGLASRDREAMIMPTILCVLYRTEAQFVGGYEAPLHAMQNLRCSIGHISIQS